MAQPLSLARSVIRDVTFRSQVTPDATMDPFAPPAPRSSGSVVGDAIMGAVKPAVYVRTPAGVVAIEPYGAPTENYLPALVVGAAAGALAAGGAIFALGVWWGRRTKGRR